MAFPNWTEKYANRIAILAHDVQTAAQMRDLVQQAAHKKLGYFYITDASGANPWDRLPSYWDEEAAAVQKLNETAAKDLLGPMREP